MQCNSCGLHSENLCEYSRAVDLGKYRKTIETIHLCGVCRVINVFNPKIIAHRMNQAHLTSHGVRELSPGALQARATMGQV